HPSPPFLIPTFLKISFGLIFAFAAGLMATVAHAVRGLLGRRDPVHVVRDPGEIQLWRKDHGTTPPIPPPPNQKEWTNSP
ncbi:MAG: hypothetical protein ABIQ12_12175, partial [Opitutaceae bacterium]